MYIKSFVFSCSIHKLYSGAKLILKDFCKMYFNEIKNGMEVTVTLREAEPENCTEGQNQFTNHMRVLSFQKIPGTESVLTDEVEINLISSWFFVNKIGTGVYIGSVGEILSGLCETLISANAGFARGEFYTSTSDPGRRRYQINEKIQSFMKKLLKYGYVGAVDAQKRLTSAYPIYLYMDAKNQLNLRCLGDYLNGSIKYSYLPDQADLAFNKSGKVSLGQNVIRLVNYKIVTSKEPTASSETTYFTTAGFTSMAGFQTKSKMTNSENNNPSTAATTPDVVLYKKWDLTPQDAFATSIKEYCETNLNTFALVGVLNGFELNAAALGELVAVTLPAKDTAQTGQTISNGGYVVDKVEYVFENDFPQTRVHMFLAKFSSAI